MLPTCSRKTWQLPMRLNHLLTERLVGKRAKFSRNNPFSLPSPQQSWVTWLPCRQHGYSDHFFFFFPHWQWLSARGGLRFGPWQRRLWLLVETTCRRTFCLKKKKKKKKCLLKPNISLLYTLTYTHNPRQIFGTADEQRDNIKLNCLFVWFVIYYSYWKVSHEAIFIPS